MKSLKLKKKQQEQEPTSFKESDFPQVQGKI